MGFDEKLQNKAQDAAGRAKEFIGDKTGDRDLQAEGTADRTEAGARDLGEKVKDAGEDLQAKARGVADAAKDMIDDTQAKKAAEDEGPAV
ncbi:CsbD family protein [Nigerium massiliense]|uniref:CsbD family protein n=1 Tax=Nigerium massiliense TaxID=1522317 RepID=UPI0006938E70|nr:CsbD family protein [Nigerium massiliense]